MAKLIPPTQLDARTREIGHDLFARVRRSGSGEPWLDRQLMAAGMADEQVKAQLFRFVDVLPVLNAAGGNGDGVNRISGHLREYLEPVRDRLPGMLGRLIPRMPVAGFWGDRLADLARWSARRMAGRFIAADSLPQAIRTIRRMRGRRMAFTVDLLGEAVLSEVEAEKYHGQYRMLVTGLCASSRRWHEIPLIDRDHRNQPIPRVNVSIKLSSLYSQFDPIDAAGTSERVRARLREILRLARRSGAAVNVDMEQFAYKDVTLRIFKEIFAEPEFRDWPDVGIAIQAYLRSCEEDLEGLAEWVRQRGTPVWVRLVKGAYWDFETIIAAQNGWPVPVFSEKAATDANYEAMTAFLMAHHHLLRPAIASHNIRSLAHALAQAERHRLPPRSFEFQMLYGMAEPIKASLAKLGHRVRIYTPYGELLPGMAYLVRRLLENTSNESFLRAGFTERVPEEKLLMNPMKLIRRKRIPKVGNGEMGNGESEVIEPRHSPFPTSPFPVSSPTPFRNEPVSDFSQEEPRRQMQSAVDAQKTAGDSSYPLVIGGRQWDADQHLTSWNPSHSRQTVGRTASATKEHALEAVTAAKQAFPSWRDTAPAERAALLFRCAAIMRRRRFELAAVEVHETAKPWREADADVAEAIDFCEFYGREMLRLAAPQSRNLPGEENDFIYEPRGVTVIIAPWNFPLAILCGMTAAAVVAGNTAIMKPAEQSPIIAAKLMEIFEEAGTPAGVVNFLPGVGEEVGPPLVDHPDVALIAFTGSRAVGLAIQKQAAVVHPGQEVIKRVITELGGKNAVIIDEDADLDEAVHGVAWSAFGYAGQKCSACSRAIVPNSIYDAFVARLVEVARSLRIGPSEEPGTFVSPVIDAEARDRILATIEKGKSEARLVYSADLGPLAEEGFFVPPTIFADVSPESSLAQEEIFGPVLAVIRCNDLTDALRIANGTKYALTGGLFSRSPANIDRVRREFRVGNLYVNRKITGALVDRQPFGGFKLSGIGSKAGGTDYLQQFMWPRTITENTLRRGFAPQAEETSPGM